MYSSPVYTYQEDSKFYERFIESFIEWASHILNKTISGDVFVLLSDGHLLCDLIMYIFPQFRNDLIQSGIDLWNGNFIMIYYLLCDRLELDESHRVTQEIIESQSLDQLVHVLEDLISAILKYYSPTYLNLPNILYRRRSQQYWLAYDSTQYSNPYPHGIYPQGYSAPMYVIPEVHVSPTFVPSEPEDIRSIPSISTSSQSETHLFKSEEVSNQLKCQQFFLDQLENKMPNEDYELMGYGNGGYQVEEPKTTTVSQSNNKKKLTKLAILGSSLIAATGIALGVATAVSKSKKK